MSKNSFLAFALGAVAGVALERYFKTEKGEKTLAAIKSCLSPIVPNDDEEPVEIDDEEDFFGGEGE